MKINTLMLQSYLIGCSCGCMDKLTTKEKYKFNKSVNIFINNQCANFHKSNVLIVSELEQYIKNIIIENSRQD